MAFLCLFGIVVPGVSSTIILMLLGIYKVYLASVSSVYLPILIPLGFGVLVGGFCFMKVTKFLLEKFYAPTFYGIIGFTIGSNFSSFWEVLLGGLCCVLRFLYCFCV